MIDIGGIFSGIGSLIGAGTGIYDSIQNAKNQQAQLEEQKRLNNWTMDYNERTFKQNQENWQNSFDFANEQFNYQKDLNKTVMDREDTAVQRRMADLQQAGLSKWAGLGTSAQTASLSSGSYGTGSAGHSNTGGLNAGQAVQQDFAKSIFAGVNIANMIQGMQTRSIENDLMKADILKRVAEVDNVRADTKNKGSQNENIQADTKNKIQQRQESISRTFKTDIETDTLLYNLEQSIISGLRTNDAMNGYYNMINDVVRKSLFNLVTKNGGGSTVAKRRIFEMFEAK